MRSVAMHAQQCSTLSGTLVSNGLRQTWLQTNLSPFTCSYRPESRSNSFSCAQLQMQQAVVSAVQSQEKIGSKQMGLAVITMLLSEQELTTSACANTALTVPAASSAALISVWSFL